MSDKSVFSPAIIFSCLSHLCTHADHPQRSDGILACDLQPVNLNPSSPLYLNGLCLWPGCDETFADYSHFLQHLDNDHNYGDKAFAQWKVQQDMVQHLENQLILEKEKLHAMQLHLNLASLITTSKVAGSDLIGSLAVSAGRAEGTYGDPLNASEEPGVPVQQKLWNIPHAHLLPDIMSDIELYKHTDIRPPYTYASLIRWSILEAPDKQQTLNEIYNWFTRMFYYFRHNNAAWKNAVRHNLSLHKCFVRVEGAKGAVWTVDEVEFQRRKKQKFNR
uniref:Fork-head domain-containing protein n=1 Tax=Denticeps clupeoides TaxID=299321 RepID=A0AAY4DTF9_9TELE